ncbi:MAG: HAD-IIB family hydrolase [Chromatocurvus sp.]
MVSDLDGTLLDHDTYSCEAAEPALDLLESLSIPLVLASSKTAPEVRRLRRQLGNVHPFIVENGAAIWMPASDRYQRPEGTLLRDGYWVRELASPRARWLGLLDALRADFAGEFTSFAEAGPVGIAAMTGLDLRAAELANLRQYSEPVQWLGTPERLLDFLGCCRAAGGRVSSGGRFHALSSNVDKGVALRWLRQEIARSQPGRPLHVLAAGDGDNDTPMLECADTALVVRAPDREAPLLARRSGVIRSECGGPAGWAEGITRWLCERHLVSSTDAPVPRDG